MLEVILEFILFAKKKDRMLFTSLIYFCLLEIIYYRKNNKSTEGKEETIENLIRFHQKAREGSQELFPFSLKKMFFQSLHKEQITKMEFYQRIRMLCHFSKAIIHILIISIYLLIKCHYFELLRVLLFFFGSNAINHMRHCCYSLSHVSLEIPY